MRISTTTVRPDAGLRRLLIVTLLGLSAAAVQAHATGIDEGARAASLHLARGPGQAQGRGPAQAQPRGQSQPQAQGQGQGQQKAKEKQKPGGRDTQPAQDRDRDQDRERDRPEDVQPIYGRELMTEQERREYQERMRTLRTEEERRAYREEHHRQMQSRAAERGLTLPEPSPQTAPGDARQKRDSDRGE